MLQYLGKSTAYYSTTMKLEPLILLSAVVITWLLTLLNRSNGRRVLLSIIPLLILAGAAVMHFSDRDGQTYLIAATVVVLGAMVHIANVGGRALCLAAEAFPGAYGWCKARFTRPPTLD